MSRKYEIKIWNIQIFFNIISLISSRYYQMWLEELVYEKNTITIIFIQYKNFGNLCKDDYMAP